MTGGIMRSLGMGLFDNDIGKEANNSFVGSIIEKLWGATEESQAEALAEAGEASAENAGLFDAENVQSAILESISEIIKMAVYSSDLNNVVSSALDSKNEVQRQQVLAEVSRALNYEQSASDTANITNANTGWVDPVTGEVIPNPLDYTDQIKGEVNPLNYLADGGTASSIEQQRASAETAGTAALMSVDELVQIEESHARRYEAMIMLLQELVEQGRPGLLSKIVGSLSGGTPPPQRNGIKSIARDFTRGFWDMSFGDFSPGSVTTEGRGGSA